MRSSQKVNQWHFGRKTHICVDADYGLGPTLRGKADHVADVTDGNAPAHGEETGVYFDGGCQGADKRPDAKPDVRRSIAIRPGKRRELDKAGNPVDALIDKIGKCKAGIRAKVKPRFLLVKRQFRFVKMR